MCQDLRKVLTHFFERDINNIVRRFSSEGLTLHNNLLKYKENILWET